MTDMAASRITSLARSGTRKSIISAKVVSKSEEQRAFLVRICVLTDHLIRPPRPVPIILVGLKTDLRNDQHSLSMLSAQGLRPVSYEQGAAVAKEIGAAKYVECSAKTRQGVQEVFDSALREVLKKRWGKRSGGSGSGGGGGGGSGGSGKKCLVL